MVLRAASQDFNTVTLKLQAPELETRISRGSILLMDKILHDLKDPKLWELWIFNRMCGCQN